MGFFDKIKAGLTKTRDALGATLSGVFTGFSELDDDFYDFDEKAFCLTGRRFRKKYSLGDPIRIKVVRANLERKQLDFALVE